VRSLSRGYFAGASRHRTSTTRACVHEGLLLMRRANCIRLSSEPASKKSEHRTPNLIANSYETNVSASHSHLHFQACGRRSFPTILKDRTVLTRSLKVIFALLTESC
jgi:hypothetical protein